jgi:KDO2-lipid IV(A) lauroyltransferase
MKLKNLWLWITIQSIRKLIVVFSYKIQIKLGFIIANVTYPLVKRRKKITINNLKVAFPNKKPKEIKQLCRRLFHSISSTGIEMLISWFSNSIFFKGINIKTHGMKNFSTSYNNKSKGILLLSAHFSCMEIIGRYIGEYYKYIHVVYQKNTNTFLENFITARRTHYLSHCIQRKNILKIVKVLKRGNSIWYAPDQDFKQKKNIFVPFF